MKRTVIIVSIILAISAVLYYLHHQKPMIEKMCDQKIDFKVPSKVLNTSQRAMTSDINFGSCPNDTSQKTLIPEMSIVIDRNTKYLLQSACVSLKYKSVDLNLPNNSNTVTFVFEKTKHLLYLFLLNPAYVEFETSTPYKIDHTYRAHVDNYLDNSDTVSIKFARLVPFDLKKDDASELVDCLKANEVNAKIYFVNTPYPILMHPKYDPNEVGQITIYNKKYASIQDKTSEEYMFNDKLKKSLMNPTLTCRVELYVPKTRDYLRKKTEIFKLYMDASTGSYTSCPNYAQLKINKNNIVSAYVHTNAPEDEFFYLTFATNNNKDGAECSVGDALELQLPFVPGFERFQVTFTVTPSEKIVLCTWNVRGQDFYYFKRSSQCKSDNQFKKLVDSKINEDIKFAYLGKHVKAIKYVQIEKKTYVDDFNPR